MAATEYSYHLPIEILITRLNEHLKGVIGDSNTLQKSAAQDSFKPLAVSKTVNAIVRPLLLKRTRKPTSQMMRCLCRTMLSRPHSTNMVRELDFEEEEDLYWISKGDVREREIPESE
ncbi:hypothetical protein BDW69DRAFT_184781 [Aspergillus filifer]